MDQKIKFSVDATEAGKLRRYRLAAKENQLGFWSRFGVTQSRGSRFEHGAEIPAPVAILLGLYFSGVITDSDLHAAGECYQISKRMLSEKSGAVHGRVRE